MNELHSTDPFLRLRAHAESRRKMTKAELLKDAADGDEAFVNMWTERDMEQAYREALDRHLIKVHGCTHDHALIADEDARDAEELHPAAPWNDVSD
jgi:hypothetical protein